MAYENDSAIEHKRFRHRLEKPQVAKMHQHKMKIKRKHFFFHRLPLCIWRWTEYTSSQSTLSYSDALKSDDK